ncbi:MAG: SoxR reducing system RseC family protein [Bacteroidales bacterium]|jgi:sigma-E factor negative regulatory protein RseC|nr:SoxR reducing system RseC family protein [Bacteroidales bacterium]
MLEHVGIISKKENNKFTVELEVQSACASCHAKGMCTSLDSKTKKVETFSTDDSFEIGEKVLVKMKESLGFKAIFFGYILPFIVMFATIIILLNIFHSEGIAGLFGILSLLPYYLSLYMFRENLDKKFVFIIEKV